MTARRDYFVLSRTPTTGRTLKVLAGPLLTLTHARSACARLRHGGVTDPVIVRYWSERRER